MKKFLIITYLIVSSISFGQSIKIYGKVLDSLGGPIPGTTAMLVGSQDSILKSFAISNKDGLFTLTGVKPGQYIFKANFYGFDPYEIPLTVEPGASDMAIGEIKLKPKMLNTVNVQGHYIPISIKGDTIEYDARAFETGEHDVVEDLLEQLPGVEVADDGSIKVQGKDVDKILVDGEEFFGSDVSLATKNLPANAIDKVQVYDKQSDMSEFTGIDDGDELTTINLKLKEDHKKGVFGNFEAAYGGNENKLDRYIAKGNVHFFKKKWQMSIIGMSNNINQTGFSINDYINFMGGIQNLMSGGGGSFGDGGLPLSWGGADDGFLNTNATGFNFNFKPNENGRFSSSIFFNTFDKTYDKNIERTTYFTDSSLFTYENTIQNSYTLNNTVNLHYKQEIDSTHFLNLYLDGSWSSGDYYNEGNIQNFNRYDSLVNTYLTTQSQNNFQYNFKTSADYRKKFKRKGQYTGGGISYAIDKNESTTYLNYLNSFYLTGPTNPLIQNIDQKQSQLITSGTINSNWMFSQPLGRKNLIQLGIEHNRTFETRDKDVLDVLTVDNSIINNLLSGSGGFNTFKDIVELKHKYITKKLKITTTLSYDYLNFKGDSLFTNKREFTYLMPAFKIRWKPNKSSDIRFNYNTSLTLPSLIQLQPIPNNTNPAETILGNTNLIPEYNHNISLRYNTYNEFSFTHFMAQVRGTYVQNNITYSQTIDSLYNRILTPENIGDEKQLNTYVAFGTSFHPIKTKFNLSNSSNLSNGQVSLNSQMDEYTSIYTSTSLSIENIGKKIINIKTGITYTWSKNIYKENQNFNNAYTNWNYFADLTIKIKDKWEFNTRADHFLYPDFDNASELLLINASIARNFLDSKKLQVYVKAVDILNQNTGIDQYYYMNYYEKERTATLGRYFLLGVKYSFQKLGAN